MSTGTYPAYPKGFYFHRRKGGIHNHEVRQMEGKFCDIDELIDEIEKKTKNTMSEGAQWWLMRIHTKTQSFS
jgi:hypothetical protein